MTKNGIRFVCLIFFVAIVVIGVVLFKQVRRVRPDQIPLKSITAPLVLPERPVDEIRAEWRSEVERILVQYDQDQNPRIARDALLPLTVAAGDREIHLALVLGLSDLVENGSGTKKKFVHARAAFQRTL